MSVRVSPTCFRRAAVAGRALVRGALVLWAVLAASGCSSTAPTSTPAAATPQATVAPVVVAPETFRSLVLDSTRPALLEFQRPTCPYCQAMAPTLVRLATQFQGRATVGTADVEAFPEFRTTHSITAVPTFVFYANGREVRRQVGATTYEDLAATLEGLVAAR